MTWIDRVLDLNPCSEAMEWLTALPAESTSEEAWATCERGDWLLWIAFRMNASPPLLVRAACACARLALPYVPAVEPRPLGAIETAETWARGESSIKAVKLIAAAAAASSAADAAAADAAYYAARSAASAASAAASAAAAADRSDAAYYAARSAASAASAAASAAYAGAHATAAAARVTTLRRCAELVREIVPCPEVQS